MRSRRIRAYFLVFLTPIACAGAHDPGVQATQEAGVTAPSGLPVSVALASAHLGAEGCTHDESGGLTLRSCAVALDAGTRGSGPCGGPCEFSSVVLAFSSGNGTSAAHIQITKVAMLDGATGQELQARRAKGRGPMSGRKRGCSPRGCVFSMIGRSAARLSSSPSRTRRTRIRVSV